MISPSLKETNVLMYKLLEGGFLDVCLILQCPELAVAVRQVVA